MSIKSKLNVQRAVWGKMPLGRSWMLEFACVRVIGQLR
jgi:hypothetical protein